MDCDMPPTPFEICTHNSSRHVRPSSEQLLLKIDVSKLEGITNKMLNIVGGFYAEAGVSIGEMDGKVIRLVAYSKEEAEENDFSVRDADRCITKGDAA